MSLAEFLEKAKADPIVRPQRCEACGKLAPYGLENHYEKGNSPECRPVISESK